jgi:hypothetical protein
VELIQFKSSKLCCVCVCVCVFLGQQPHIICKKEFIHELDFGRS